MLVILGKIFVLKIDHCSCRYIRNRCGGSIEMVANS